MDIKISVCMASYNGQKYIEEQVFSILEQLGENDELIVSDDGSSDNTLEILSSIEDSRLKVIINEKEQGYTKNFENALQNASGDYFFLSDQDDIWLNNKLNVMLEELRSSNFVMCNGKIVNKDLIYSGVNHFEKFKVKTGFVRNFLKTRYVGAFMAFDKEVYNKILPFPNNQYLAPHDYWITCIVEMGFKVTLINEPLMLYRRHDSNVTGDGSKRDFFLRIKQRVYVLFKIFVRMIK